MHAFLLVTMIGEIVMMALAFNTSTLERWVAGDVQLPVWIMGGSACGAVLTIGVVLRDAVVTFA